MSINRRDLVKLFGAGVVLSAPKELLPLPQEVSAIEVKEGKQYLMILQDYAPPESCKEFENWLRSCGLNIIVIAQPEAKLYEIERSTK